MCDQRGSGIIWSKALKNQKPREAAGLSFLSGENFLD
jgi:hypothetical protein